MLFLTMVKLFLSSISFKALIVVNNFRDVRGWAPNRSREPGNENPAKSPQALCQRLSARRAAILPRTRAGGRGQLVFRATEIARTMIIAIVTSREAEPGKSKWLTNNDLAKSFSCRFSHAMRNMAMKKQKIHGILLIYCPKNTMHFKNKPFKVRKHADFEIGQLKTRQ